MILHYVLAGFLVVVANGHRYGADMQACDTMKPGHGVTRRQTRATPYIVETHQPGYVPCSVNPLVNQFPNCGVMVRIRTRRGGNFKGFFLQARSKMPDGSLRYVGDFRYATGQMIPTSNRNGARIQGQFGTGGMGIGQRQAGIGKRQVARQGFGGQFGNQQFGNQQFGNQQFGNQFNQGGMFQRQTTNVVVQKLPCAKGFGVTHTENNLKNYVQLIWYPPVGFNRPIEFVATVVQDFNTYWMGHRSATLRSRPRLTMDRTAAAQTGRWFNRYNSAPRTGVSIILLFVSICSALFYFL